MALTSKQSKRRRREEESEEEGFGGGDLGLSDDDSVGEMEEEDDEGEEAGCEDVEDGDERGGEMDQLEKEYLSIRNEQQNLVKDLKRKKDEERLKGLAVKNQQTLWHRSLEFRFLLQKTFSSSNKLPREPVRSSYCNSDNAVSGAFSDLVTSAKNTLNCLTQLQEALVENNPAIDQAWDGVSTDLEDQDDEDWSRIFRTQSRLVPFRNNAINKWHRKSQVTTGAAAFKGKLHAFNQSISDQVAIYMRDPNRMINRMLLRRSAVNVFGEVSEKAGDKKEEENMDGDAELIDDSEFYQQLLKEFFESCNLNSSESGYYAVKKLQKKKRKAVDRRASKSRKIRYNVHEKIVNFTAPKPMNCNDMASKLCENLFGLRSKKPATEV